MMKKLSVNLGMHVFFLGMFLCATAIGGIRHVLVVPENRGQIIFQVKKSFMRSHIPFETLLAVVGHQIPDLQPEKDQLSVNQ